MLLTRRTILVSNLGILPLDLLFRPARSSVLHRSEFVTDESDNRHS